MSPPTRLRPHTTAACRTSGSRCRAVSTSPSLDTEAVDLHLVIGAAGEAEDVVGGLYGEVAAAVEATRTARRERQRPEAPRGWFGKTEVSGRDSGARRPDRRIDLLGRQDAGGDEHRRLGDAVRVGELAVAADRLPPRPQVAGVDLLLAEDDPPHAPGARSLLARGGDEVREDRRHDAHHGSGAASTVLRRGNCP